MGLHRIREKFIDAGQRAKHFLRNLFRRVLAIKCRELSDSGIACPHGLNGCERATIGSTELHDAFDADIAFNLNCRPCEQASHAVAYQHHSLIFRVLNSREQLTRKSLDVAPPIESVQHGTKSSDLEPQAHL